MPHKSNQRHKPSDFVLQTNRSIYHDYVNEVRAVHEAQALLLQKSPAATGGQRRHRQFQRIHQADTASEVQKRHQSSYLRTLEYSDSKRFDKPRRVS